MDEPSGKLDASRSSRLLYWPRLWFGVSAPVTPLPYALSGFGLMALKYAVEASVVWVLTLSVMWPWQFLNPMISLRQELFANARPWLAWAWVLWTLPFMWIAASMSIRRATDAGRSPWLGLAVLVPLANLVMMPVLAVWPHDASLADAPPAETASQLSRKQSAAVGVAAGVVVGGIMLCVSVYLLMVYGSALFWELLC